MDISGHNLPLLVSLSVMLDERNITRAAARLGISQPALSAQLVRLRDVFDDQLLTPAHSGRGMVLTPRAVALREPLREALQQLADVIAKPVAFNPYRSDRIFTIGANDNASAIMGPRLVQSLREQSINDVRLSFRIIDSTKLSDQLEAGDLDIALLSRNAVPAGLLHEPLLEEKFMMAQRKGHPRGCHPPTIDEYAELKHVIVSSDGGGFRGFIDDILEQNGLKRRIGISVQYYNVVPLILSSSDFVCTLPSRFLERYSDSLTSMHLPFTARQFNLHATWHARFHKDPGHAWLREQLMACSKD